VLFLKKNQYSHLLEFNLGAQGNKQTVNYLYDSDGGILGKTEDQKATDVEREYDMFTSLKYGFALDFNGWGALININSYYQQLIDFKDQDIPHSYISIPIGFYKKILTNYSAYLGWDAISESIILQVTFTKQKVFDD